MCATSASTCSISRRSTRSARPTARAATTRLHPEPDDPGSPYAIGSRGGRPRRDPPRARHASRTSAGWSTPPREHGLEIALDFAIQCSPDHPWIKEHPEWFDWRPDGTIKFAENPPKKYEDIVNVHFYRGAIPDLWYALRDIVLFWVEQGVQDLPRRQPAHQAVPLLGMDDRARCSEKHPDAIFLAEAFTRPKVMKRLAKVGFTQSYSYFTWRNDEVGARPST